MLIRKGMSTAKKPKLKLEFLFFAPKNKVFFSPTLSKDVQLNKILITTSFLIFD